MNIIIKSLKQVPYEVTVPSGNCTVHELKQIVANTYNFDKNSIKFLFNGTVLENSHSMTEYGIKEDHVLIMINVKPKIISPEKIAEEVKLEKITHPKKEDHENSIYANEVNILREMGFPLEKAENCLSASKGDINLALEYIENGVPDNEEELIEENEEKDENESQPQAEDDESPLKVLENIASVVKLLCKNDSNQIHNVLVNLNRNHPETIDLITENEAEFKNLVTKPVTNEDIAAYQRFQEEELNNYNESDQSNDEDGIKNETDNNNNDNNENNNINLSEEDYNAVQRLKYLGFSDVDACQAYFAFDKNENLAANFLYENKQKDSDDLYTECNNLIFN